jgi:hypothetical protein
VRPISGRTCIWFTPGTSYSIGSSMVTMRRSVELICRRKALSEVDLPEPVGPVTRMMPCGIVENADDLFLLGLVHAEALHRVGFFLLVEQAERAGLGVNGGDGGNADIEDDAGGFEVDAAVLRKALFGDVERAMILRREMMASWKRRRFSGTGTARAGRRRGSGCGAGLPAARNGCRWLGRRWPGR